MTLIVAEVGSTHDGSVGQALAILRALQMPGGSAVKWQDHLGDVSSRQWHPSVERQNLLRETRSEYLERTCFDDDAWRLVARETRKRGWFYAVSPFSSQAAERQERCCAPDIWKIASGQVANQRLLELVGECAQGRTVLVSSGMGTPAEVARARAILRERGATDVRTLCCTSEYPTPPEHARFGEWTDYDGLSDHTEGTWAPIAACALGLGVLEKHVTLSRYGYGTDSWHSMDVDSFNALVQQLGQVEAARRSTARPNTDGMRAAYMGAAT